MTRHTEGLRLIPADAFSPDSVRGDGGPDGPVGSGATGETVDGVDAIEGPRVRVGGTGLPVGFGTSSADQQTAADAWGDSVHRGKAAEGCRFRKQSRKKMRALFPL